MKISAKDWRHQRFHYLETEGKAIDAEGRTFFYQLEEREVELVMNPTSPSVPGPWDCLTLERAFNSEHISFLLLQSESINTFLRF